MTRIARALVAAIALAVATAVLAGIPPSRPHAAPSSYAPQPFSGAHVYGAPLGPPVVGGHTANRKHAAAKHAAKASAHQARETKPLKHPAAVYAQADPS